MSDFACMLSLPDGYARVTHVFILVWAKKGPTSSGRGERVCIILHLSACTGVNTSGIS